MSYKTVVKVMEVMVNEEGIPVDIEGNPIKVKDEPGMVEVLYYLLHWGLHMEILVDQKSGERYPVSYTVGICQHIKNGSIRIFAPEELTVIGKEKL